MGRLEITEFLMYKRRYILGYVLVFVSLVAVLIFAGLYLPGGISTQEMQSVVKSDSLKLSNINSLAVIDLPYHLLQKASIAIFGVSVFSIKLVSIILAFFSAIGMIFLLKIWFKANVGILASLIAITTGQFLFIAQDGTPNILYMFWSVWLVLLATIISRQRRFRRVLFAVFFVLAALSLYTPLSIYTLIALVGAVILHPHLRYLLRQLPKYELIAGTIFTIILLIPLIISVFKDPGSILTLIGIPMSWPNLSNNFSILGSQYLGFAQPSGSTIMTPFFELGSILIILIGLYQTLKTKATAQSYIIILWVICLIPIMILNPNLSSITFLPLVLLLAYGIGALLGNWYDIFPRNPYARIGGLIPITILIAVLVYSGMDRYIHGYRYDPSIASSFSKDIKLIPKKTTSIIVGNDELSFYKVIAKRNKKLQIINEPRGDSFLATRKAKNIFTGYDIDRIITTSTTNEADRFYLYKKIIDKK